MSLYGLRPSIRNRFCWLSSQFREMRTGWKSIEGFKIFFWIFKREFIVWIKLTSNASLDIWWHVFKKSYCYGNYTYSFQAILTLLFLLFSVEAKLLENEFIFATIGNNCECYSNNRLCKSRLVVINYFRYSKYSWQF